MQTERSANQPERPAITQADLDQFSGSETWYKHGLMPRITYTDGVKYLAETAKAWWLVDEVATNQLIKKVKAEEFQVWKLVVQEGKKAILTCDDGNDHVVFSKIIEYTDFPLERVKLYFSGNVILLPSEY